ncbi:MAG: ABC transporter permease, partial [Anaerolineales bacterium]
MENEVILIGLAGVLASAAPVIFATIGETFAERSGVVNLSVNGTMLLTAMAGFVAAVLTKSVVVGFLVGLIVGALVALLVAFSSITLKLSQVAVGYVLTMTCRDLAYFLGNPYV